MGDVFIWRREIKKEGEVESRKVEGKEEERE